MFSRGKESLIKPSERPDVVRANAVTLKTQTTVSAEEVVKYLSGEDIIPVKEVDTSTKLGDSKPHTEGRDAHKVTYKEVGIEAKQDATETNDNTSNRDAIFDPAEIERRFKEEYPQGKILGPIEYTPPVVPKKLSDRLAVKGVKQPTLIHEIFRGDSPAHTIMGVIPDTNGVQLIQYGTRPLSEDTISSPVTETSQ